MPSLRCCGFPAGVCCGSHTTYGVTRLDMDVEAKSLNNKAGIARRSEAIALLQHWAARTHRHVQIVLTLGVEPAGLPDNCLAIVKSAIAHGVKIAAVNIMAFDYYNSNRASDMGTEAIEALDSAHWQLAHLFPRLSARQIWRMIGITLLPGIDDFPRKTEVTYLSEVQDILYYARQHPVSLITIWAIQRDNGRCPGAIDSNSCSGIVQSRWAFSHLIEALRTAEGNGLLPGLIDCYRRGSTGSLSSASTPNTHSCTRYSGSPATNRSSASMPSANSRSGQRAACARRCGTAQPGQVALRPCTRARR